ncbi:Phosphatidylinositol-4-phosphate 5-kinase [Coemansia sp. RSA 2336]|nr:Phosphatidylinositol-4-phosphate 5-kinase [Coemansia sp. RSA 2336]
MVLLTHQGSVPSRPNSKAATLVTTELPVKGQLPAHKMASFDSGHTSFAPHNSMRNTMRRRANDTISTSSKTSSSFEDAPGPLLPIRQHRRGVNPNRNYRVFGTQSASAADMHSHRKQSESAAASIAAPPTPVSALGSTSTAGSSASQNSTGSRPTPEQEPGSCSSTRSSKSTIASVSSAVNFSAGTSPASTSLLSRGGRLREYDKHNYEVQELPMDPIVLSGHNSAASLASSHRMSRSYGQLYGADPEARSSAVRVSSLLPGARTSPAVSNRRLHPQYVSPSGSSVATEGGMITQKFIVQRVSNRISAEQASESIHTTTQICIASPQIRLHNPKHNSYMQTLNTLEERSAQTQNTVANGDTPAYFADTEMDSRSSAMQGSVEAAAAAAAVAAAASATTTSAATGKGNNDVSAYQSWNLPSDDDSNSRLTDRQRRRRGMNSSATTEKFHVRPVSVVKDGPEASSNNSTLPAIAVDESPVVAPYNSSSPRLAAVSDQSLQTGSHFYAESSADEFPASEDHVRFPGHTMDKQPYNAPKLAYRATSFDLGRVGPLDTRSDQINGRDVSHKVAVARNSVLSLRNRARSSDKLAALSRARSTQVEKVEEGYEGDSEVLMSSSMRIPVHRRNTVAGDKIETMSSSDYRPVWQRMPRNTSDLSGWGGKENRRTIRSSRRRSIPQSLLPIGTQISPGHANYVLMYNMLTGIRVSVSRSEAKDRRPVRADDYTAMHKYSFDVVGDEMTSSSRYDFKFKDYAPWVFRCIREAFHLSTEDYLVSLTDKYILSEVGSSGKSGSFFYYSQDYRFIIKTVHHTEHKFMRQILPQYYEFVRDHPHTLLSRIYGLHRIKLPQGRKVHFIVMSNILPPNKDIHAQFDLKGSMQGRELSAELASKPRACMKDKNWVKMRQRLHLGPTKRREFVKQLIEDVTLLIRLNIMDYSLLIGIHDLNKGNAAKLRDTTLAMFDPRTTDIQQLNRLTRAHTIRKKVVHTDPVALDALPQGTLPPLPESMFQELRYSMFYREDGGILSTDQKDNPAQLIYYLGVIDILTPYNAVKRTEHVLKSMVHDGSQISAINPRKYGMRFLQFMIRSLDGYEDVLPLLDKFERTTYQEICREHRLF